MAIADNLGDVLRGLDECSNIIDQLLASAIEKIENQWTAGGAAAEARNEALENLRSLQRTTPHRLAKMHVDVQSAIDTLNQSPQAPPQHRTAALPAGPPLPEQSKTDTALLDASKRISDRVGATPPAPPQQ